MADYSLREVFKQFGKKIFGSCVNSCVSESQNLPLAASQGKVLQDQITQLNSNMIMSGNIIRDGSIEYDSAIFAGKETKPLFIHAVGAVDVSKIKGMPQGVYGFGALITIMNVVGEWWGSGQIYIPHNRTDVYIRMFADNNFSTWRKLVGVTVSKVS